ncbi:MAG: DUF3276 family protein [Bacteroidales bacterium]|nr:DUF3276 family protein [Bacteroidales bacterium]
MEDLEHKDKEREEIFSKAVRAGKRTYFFDVKATRSDEYYLTITESKRRFSNDQGKFFYEKHKLFLYKEDFDKFSKGLRDVIEFIRTGKIPPPDEAEEENGSGVESHAADIDFEDLGIEHPSASGTDSRDES